MVNKGIMYTVYDRGHRQPPSPHVQLLSAHLNDRETTVPWPQGDRLYLWTMRGHSVLHQWPRGFDFKNWDSIHPTLAHITKQGVTNSLEHLLPAGVFTIKMPRSSCIKGETQLTFKLTSIKWEIFIGWEANAKHHQSRTIIHRNIAVCKYKSP